MVAVLLQWAQASEASYRVRAVDICTMLEKKFANCGFTSIRRDVEWRVIGSLHRSFNLDAWRRQQNGDQLDVGEAASDMQRRAPHLHTTSNQHHTVKRRGW